MTAPLGEDLDLQTAITTALEASADLKSLIGDPPRIKQSLLSDTLPPYITVGEAQVIDASDSCVNAVEVYPAIHVWSRPTQGSGSFREAKQIAAAVKAVLHNAVLPLTQNRCFSILFDRQDAMRDPDGVTRHISITFKSRVEAVTP